MKISWNKYGKMSLNERRNYFIKKHPIIAQNINSNKEKKIKICSKKNNYEYYFESCREAADFLDLKPSYFCRIRKNNKFYHGYSINEL